MPFRLPESSETAAARTLSQRTRTLLIGVPIVLVSTIAITLNLASPAHAQALAKKPLKSKSTGPASATGTDVASSTATVAAAALAPLQYTVVDGDTVSAIASRFGLSTASILALNGLGWSATIFPGQVLTLSNGSGQLVAAAPQTSVSQEITRYTVVSGDTVSSIAQAHGLSTEAVLSANGLDRASVIYPGQSLSIADVASSASATSTPSPTTSVVGSQYTIAAGDTIAAVAERSGVSVQAVLDANQLGWSSIIYPGQVLTIPASGSVVAAQAPSAPVAPASADPLVTALTPEMRQNAELIVSLGRSAGVSDYGLVIALAAAAQESGLINLTYGDRDSLGLFQQRPSSGWGTAEQILDPVHSALAFYGGAGNPNVGVTRGLLDIPGWESMTVTQAAQAVQISAYPDHYAKWEMSARAWLIDLG